MSDREFILALKARCEQNIEGFDKIAALDNDLAGFTATGNSTAYWVVVKMIEVYLEEQADIGDKCKTIDSCKGIDR